jgi:uncharacterized YigZ family protein
MSGLNTVKAISEGMYKEKGSKFHAYLFPLSNEPMVKSIIASLKEEHPKARHICYAFRIGIAGDLERANDDGEPKGSAGAPILSRIHSAELTDVLLLVVRYFGGTKLGVSGLNKAYKTAAADAIENARIIVRVEKVSLAIRFPYTAIGKVEKLIERNKWNIENAKYEDPCEFTISTTKINRHAMMEMLVVLPDIEVLPE